MTKNDLAQEISGKTGIEKITVVNIIESFMETVKDNMVKNKNVYLRGFGTFLIKKRAKKTARNISKNTSIIIPAHHIPAFKANREFMDKIKNGKK
jgi:DNA-binding protein HU-beta